MSFYANLAAVATRLLTDKGQQVSFSRTTGATFNPATGVYSGGSTSAWNGYGAAFDYNASEVDGEIIQKTDIRLMLNAVTTPPKTGDACTVAGTAYRVMGVITSAPGGTTTHYEVQLRV